MATPPTRAEISGTPSRATANTGFGKLWDYVTGLLGSTGNASDARTALGATTTGGALFTTANASAARTTLGATATGAALFMAADAAAARQAAGVPNSGPLSGLRNLIINGNFSVNQRGYASGAAVGAANTYTLDRWRVVASGQAASYTTSGAGRLVTAPAGGIEQVIEGASIGGGTYVINWTGTASCTVNGVSRIKGATFSLTAGTNATVRFSSGTVTDVQIEPGEVATAFELRPAAVELMLCQRYYQADLGHKRWGYGLTAQPFGDTIRFAVPMRAAPTVIQTNPSYVNCSGNTIELTTPNGFTNFATVTSAGSATLIFDWTASAEL